MSRGRAQKHITLDSSLMQEVQAYADEHGLPFSYVNERALRQFLDTWKRRGTDDMAKAIKQLKGEQ